MQVQNQWQEDLNQRFMFSMTPWSIIEDPNLTAEEKLILILTYRENDQTRDIWQISSRLGIHRDDVTKVWAKVNITE